MSLSKGIKLFGEIIRPAEPEWGDVEETGPQLDPRLRTTYSPRVSWRDPHAMAESIRPSLPEWSRVWDYGPTAEALGLSLAQRSKRGTREGLKGLPPAGRKQVWRALCLLEEMRPLLSFWTVSLPTEALHDLARLGTWAAFQDRIRQELARLLRKKGLPDLVVAVVELQPKRSRATGMPCPHLHVVFQGRSRRSGPWALSPTELDGVIGAALATAGVHEPWWMERAAWLKSAGNVQQVRKSVRAYLSKYMTKSGNDVEPHKDGQFEELIPRRWWFWTRALRNWTLEHVIPICHRFIGWVHEHRQELEALGLLRVRILDLPDPRAPMTFEVNWLSLDRLAQLVYIWQTDEWDAEWHAKRRVEVAGL